MNMCASSKSVYMSIGVHRVSVYEYIALVSLFHSSLSLFNLHATYEQVCIGVHRVSVYEYIALVSLFHSSLQSSRQVQQKYLCMDVNICIHEKF